MTIKRPVLLLAGYLLIAPCWAEMDVDQADSLDFQGFHQDKKAAVKVWKEREQENPADAAPVKVYGQQSSSLSAPTTAPAGTQAQANSAPIRPASASTVDNSGKRFEIRERYTLTRSPNTPYSAFYVIEALHQQMATLCPGGWQKLEERSEPVGEDFYLYYGLQCL